MTSFSSWNLLILMMWMFSEVVSEDKVCFQCATPNLRSNWGATGLPLKPDNLNYDAKCDIVDGEYEGLPEATSANCASSCFEILIPLNGEYAAVRGCHQDFVWDEFKVTNDSCHSNLATKVGDTNYYSAIAFCAPTIASEDRCNVKLFGSKVKSDTGFAGCESDTTHSCKSCTAYDGSGSCSSSTTSTCKGVYCTKTSGKMNGGSYESRGCAYFNPIGSNVCSWTEQVYNVSTGVDMASAVVARTKRSVSLTFRANQCYCQGELCNSAPRLVSTILLSILSLSFLVFL